jgi:Transposase, Mutator family
MRHSAGGHGDAKRPDPLLVAVEVEEDFALQHVQGLIHLRVHVERRGLPLGHDILEQDEGAGRLGHRRPAAPPAGAPLTFSRKDAESMSIAYEQVGRTSQQEFHAYLRALAQSAVRTVIEAVMREELDAFIGVAWGECSPKRKGYRNGSYPRDLATSTGRLEDLKVPRDREGQFHTQAFERYSRYETQDPQFWQSTHSNAESGAADSEILLRFDSLLSSPHQGAASWQPFCREAFLASIGKTMIPLSHAQLDHRIAPIHPLRNTSCHVLTTRNHQSEYLVSCIGHRLCLQ